VFIAELGNNTLGVVDVESKKVVGRITGLKEPQGVAYAPNADLFYVANDRLDLTDILVCQPPLAEQIPKIDFASVRNGLANHRGSSAATANNGFRLGVGLVVPRRTLVKAMP
jgi:YVTN family beta-propeller protein